jgi:hypothetical protein
MAFHHRSVSHVRCRAFIVALTSALLLFLTMPLAAQDRMSLPPLPPIEPIDRGLSKLGGKPNLLNGAEIPVTPISQPLVSLDELKKDIEQLQITNDQLQQEIASASSINNKRIEQYAAKIYELANGLQRGFGSPGIGEDDTQQEDTQLAYHERLSGLASALNESMRAFVNNPVIRQPHTVDAELLAKAGLDLERIVRLSASLAKSAENRDDRSSTAARKRASGAGHKPGPFLQLTLDCAIWTADLFADRATKSENLWTMNVEGVKVQVSLHRLYPEQLVFLDECVVPEAGRKATADDERYAAVIKEFNSYEVRGRTFAYQVTYQIVRTRGGKITAHLAQSLSLYYTDEAGHGAFDLYEGKMPLRFLPDWVKDVATSR